mgnify:CR=1 FL=1|tara:strand:+ start:50 stop:388 length:339 start_codon:yes stop_codon:yes gene_type:complete
MRKKLVLDAMILIIYRYRKFKKAKRVKSHLKRLKTIKQKEEIERKLADDKEKEKLRKLKMKGSIKAPKMNNTFSRLDRINKRSTTQAVISANGSKGQVNHERVSSDSLNSSI